MSDGNLTEAAREGTKKLIKELIDKGADIHGLSSSGFPPLHYAMIVMPHNTKKDVMGTVKLLIEAGAKDDIDKPFVAGETPFMTACVEGQFEAAEYLYELGSPDLNRRLENGNSILDDVILKLKNRPTNFTVTKVKGKKVKITDKEEIRKLLGSHPDDETDAYINIVIFLLKNGIDVDSLNPNKQSALFTATGAGVESVVALLIVKGADVNKIDKFGCAPLHYACRHGYVGIIKRLVAVEANVNVQDNWGFTPAHEAAMSGHLEIVKILREAGADFTIGLTKAYDKDYVVGFSAIDVTKLKKNTEMQKLMEKPVKKKKSYKNYKFDVPPKGWEWDKTKSGYHGVDVRKQEKNLLWYTHYEHHQGGGASSQEFADFLENGSNSIRPPEEIAKELKKYLLDNSVEGK